MDFVQRFSGVPAGSLLRRSEVAAPSGGLDWKGHLPHGKISPPAFSQDAQGRAHRRNPAGNLHSAGKLSNFSGRSASGLPHLLLALVCAAYFLGISDSRLTLSGNRKPKGLPQACSLRPVRCQNTALMAGRERYPVAQRRRGHESMRGNGRREHLGRRNRTAVLSADRRCSAGISL